MKHTLRFWSWPGLWSINQCVFQLFVPFIVKLQSVLPIQWGYKLSDHSLGLLPLIPPQHPDMGHQPGHCTDGHTAHFPLDVVSNFLHSEKNDKSKKRGRKDTVRRMPDIDQGGILSKTGSFHTAWYENGKMRSHFGTSLQFLSTLLFVNFHRIRHAHLSNESIQN